MDNFTPKKVLIAEDDNILRFIIEKRLEKEGYKVIGAEDGLAALNLIEKEHPDLILLDIVMPKYDGLDVMEKLRKSGKPFPPIIILTTSITDPGIEKALSLGARTYIAKSSVAVNEIIEKVRKFIEAKPSQLPQYFTKQEKGKKNILIVEDDPILGKLIFQKLKRTKQYNVILSQSGDEAFQLMLNKQFDLILLDIILPGLNGFEIMQKAKENNLLDKTTVVILSNLSQKEEMKKGLDLGAKDYIVKSNFTLEEITDKINKYL